MDIIKYILYFLLFVVVCHTNELENYGYEYLISDRHLVNTLSKYPSKQLEIKHPHESSVVDNSAEALNDLFDKTLKDHKFFFKHNQLIGGLIDELIFSDNLVDKKNLINFLKSFQQLMTTYKSSTPIQFFSNNFKNYLKHLLKISLSKELTKNSGLHSKPIMKVLYFLNLLDRIELNNNNNTNSNLTNSSTNKPKANVITFANPLSNSESLD